MVIAGDTLFILRYQPKTNTSFNSLNGLVYITSNGYAVTHFTGSNNASDAGGQRRVKFEHIYRQVAGRWFPQELNYNFGIPRIPEAYTQLVWNGRSVIDSIVFDQRPSVKFDKAHPLKLSDSVDLRSDRDWAQYRRDSLSSEEKNTYRNMDSLLKATPVESFILFSARLVTGRLPVGVVDVDTRRIVAANRYEGTRLGLGLYTNNRLSKYLSVGGWWGYGFKDDVAKYGASLALFPKGEKENWLQFSYQKNYRLTGEVALHPELTRSALRAWLLQRVDEVKEYAVTAAVKPGYWELRLHAARTEVGPLQYPFQTTGKLVSNFTAHEATLGLRYAYGEKRVPFFEYYLPSGTKYPVVYASLSRGQVRYENETADYSRALAAITFTHRLARWGADRFRAEAGIIRTDDQRPLPRSLLLAGNGFYRDGINFYSFGGFFTMRPFDYYSDQYLSFLYRHDFDKNFWDTRWSKPFLSVAHNLVYGGLRVESRMANPALQTYRNGYHESGLMLNRLLRYNLGFADAALAFGAFYRWQKSSAWTNNTVWVVGLSTGF